MAWRVRRKQGRRIAEMTDHIVKLKRADPSLPDQQAFDRALQLVLSPIVWASVVWNGESDSVLSSGISGVVNVTPAYIDDIWLVVTESALYFTDRFSKKETDCTRVPFGMFTNLRVYVGDPKADRGPGQVITLYRPDPEHASKWAAFLRLFCPSEGMGNGLQAAIIHVMRKRNVEPEFVTVDAR